MGRFFLLLPLMLTLVSCMPQKKTKELHIYAAMSLQNVLNPIKTIFERNNPTTKVIISFASSGSLMNKIIHGAPADLFLSASKSKMKLLWSKGLVDQSTKQSFISNSLCLITPKTAKINNFVQISKALSSKSRFTIGNPDHVPVGQYAKEALSSLTLFKKFEPHLVLGSHARQVLDYVARGEVIGGIVYCTDALKRKKTTNIVSQLPPKLHSPIQYPAAIIKGSKNITLANNFVKLLLSDQIQNIFKQNGFVAINGK